MMFRPILFTLLAAVAAAPSSAMNLAPQNMIDIEHILGLVEEIGRQDGQQDTQTSMRLIQNDIHEQLAPLLNDDGAIDRTLATEIVGDLFQRHGFGDLRPIITGMMQQPPQDRAYDDLSDEAFRRRVAQLVLQDILGFGPAASSNVRIIRANAPDMQPFGLAPWANELPPVFGQRQEPRPNRAQEARPSFVHTAFEDEETCSICQEELKDANNVVCVAQCDHHYHRACIEGWQRSGRSESSNCPNCRQPIARLEPTPRQ